MSRLRDFHGKRRWPEETLKKAASGMKRKAHGAQRPRHNNELGEGASTAQRSDSPAQQFIQRFPKSMPQYGWHRVPGQATASVSVARSASCGTSAVT